MKRRTTVSYWPIYLHPVFLAVGRAMSGRQLHPDVIKDILGRDLSLLSGHSTVIVHRSGEDAKPGGNRYEIMIDGPRIKGTWRFQSGELFDLARESVSAQTDIDLRS